MNTDNEIKEITETLDGYKQLVETQQREIFELRKISSEVESLKNLVQGYRFVISDLSYKLRK
jgi:prefoldin subunit 5